MGLGFSTSVTKKAWKPYGTLCGSSTTATGSADIVFASITFTHDFLPIFNQHIIVPERQNEQLRKYETIGGEQ